MSFKNLKKRLKRNLEEWKQFIEFIASERPEISEIVKKIGGVKPRKISAVWPVLLSWIIFIQAYYPIFIGQITFSLGLILATSVCLLIIILLFSGLGALRFLYFFAPIVFAVLILFLSFFAIPQITKIVFGIDSPNYFELIKAQKISFFLPSVHKPISFGGESFAWLVFLISLGIISFISLKVRTIGELTIYCVLLILILNFGIPFAFSESIRLYKGFEKEVSFSFKTITIPKKAGIDVRFGNEQTYFRPATLLAGDPYIYYYRIKNEYERKISVNYEPFIELRFDGNSAKFYLGKREIKLSTDEIYQDELLFDPLTSNYKIEAEKCSYLVSQIANYHKIEETEVECAWDKACSEKEICLESGTKMFYCECWDWTKMTCNSYLGYLGIDVMHDGFLIGNATLYYTKEYFKEVPAVKIIQGPLRVTAILFPNPWIEKIHNFSRDYVSFSLEIEANGDVKITDFELKVLNANITTKVRGYSKELDSLVDFVLIEDVGMKILECKKEEIVGQIIPSGTKIFRFICKLSPPRIKVIFNGTMVHKKFYEVNISYEDLQKYCEFGFTNELKNAIKNLKFFEEIKGILGKSGLCKILEKKPEKEVEKVEIEEFRKIAENTLRKIGLVYEIKYVRSATYYSSYVPIYKKTEKCIKLS